MVHRKLRVVKSSKVPEGFLGMNFYAAKELHLPFPYPKNVVTVRKSSSPELQKKTAWHEKVEVPNMRDRKLPYKVADKIARAFVDKKFVHK